MQVFLFVIAILLFIGLVIVHEWGHMIAARRNGVVVEEFGLFFPPKAWSKKLKSGMVLSLNWLPLGGFVKLKGEYDSDTKKGSFGAASLGAKTKILLAGVTMNLLVGLAMLTALAWIGMPKMLSKDTIGEDQFTVASDTKVISQQVRAGSVQDNTPASKIGMASKDVIVSIAQGNDVRYTKTSGELHNATHDFAGKTVLVTYKHNNTTVTKSATLRTNKEVDQSIAAANKAHDDSLAKGNLGVSDPIDIQIQRSTWSAPVVAVGFTAQLTKLTILGLGHAIGGLGSTIAGLATGNKEARQNGQTSASSQVGGPVAIIAVLWGSGTYGLTFILWIIAVLSLTLAIMNVLPIPALDGGRLFMILYSRLLLKKPLSKMAELPLSMSDVSSRTMRHPFGVSHRAGKMEYIFSGCSSREARYRVDLYTKD
jgi:regulator of sigma E protease